MKEEVRLRTIPEKPKLVYPRIKLRPRAIVVVYSPHNEEYSGKLSWFEERRREIANQFEPISLVRKIDPADTSGDFPEYFEKLTTKSWVRWEDGIVLFLTADCCPAYLSCTADFVIRVEETGAYYVEKGFCACSCDTLEAYGLFFYDNRFQVFDHRKGATANVRVEYCPVCGLHTRRGLLP